MHPTYFGTYMHACGTYIDICASTRKIMFHSFCMALACIAPSYIHIRMHTSYLYISQFSITLLECCSV